MSSKAPEVASPVQTPKYAWAVLFALYMASLTATLNMFKLPPVMTTLVNSDLGIAADGLGTLMSTFSIMGFVLAIPAGFILKRFGIKLTVLFSVGAVTLGAALGALAATSGMLFVTRFVEGFGMGLVMVASPFAISQWFPLNNRALPTGLWATCVGIGNIAPLFLAPSIVSAFGDNWQPIWWSGAIFGAVSFVLFAIIFRMPREDEMPAAPAPPAATGEAPPSLWKGMANINYWLIGIGFGAYNLVVLALLSFLPMFLEFHRGKVAATASSLTALVMLASLFTGPLGGYISDKLERRKSVVLIVYAVMTLTLLFPFTAEGWQIPAFMIMFGIFGGPIAPILLASVPEVAKSPMLIGIGMACAAFLQNLGMFVGPTLFMGIVTAGGGVGELQSWTMAGYLMIPICIIGMIAVWRIKVR
ncbi:MAG: MFS transporter [Acidobacteriota bacterium]|jgi:MFS family permease|nr:MFS transporter [Acidobacteriota bacterium]